jgi:hypothetical protein
MTRGKRGSAFDRKTSGLERAKDQNPFGMVDYSQMKKSNIDAMKDSNYFAREGVTNVYEPSNPKAEVETGSPELNKKFKGDSKGFLDSIISGGLDYFDKVQGEKSDADKIIDFAKSQQKATQFGDFGAGGFKEVAQGLTYGQLPSQTQQMLIPGQQAQGKSLGQRLAGAAVGLGKGLMTGVPHGGAFGAVSGFFG